MRITVITPVLNLLESGRREAFLEAVRSVRAQTHGDIEHLVIDGASTDGTVALLEELKAAGEITDFRSAPDGGIYQAMNRGAAIATGDYVMFLNSDDYYHRPEGLAEVAVAAARRRCDFVASPVMVLDEPPFVFRVSAHFARILMRIPFGHPGMAVRRDTFRAYGGFDTSLPISADYDLMMRLVVAGAASEVLDEAFVSYRPGGASADNARRLEDRIRLLKKNFDTVADLPADEWRAALTIERLPPRFLRAMLASRKVRWHMKLIAAYQLFRSLRPEGRKAA